MLDYCSRNMVQVLELDASDRFPARLLDGHKNLLIMTMLQNHESKTVEMVSIWEKKLSLNMYDDIYIMETFWNTYHTYSYLFIVQYNVRTPMWSSSQDFMVFQYFSFVTYSFQIVSCPMESDRTRWVEAVTPRSSDNPDERIYEEWDCPQVLWFIAKLLEL